MKIIKNEIFLELLDFRNYKCLLFSTFCNVVVNDRSTELLHTEDCGQVSVNISRPGITKGQHWRDKIEAVYMIPGWTHNIINLSETENLVTVMMCNEVFDAERPDTFAERV